MHTLSVKNRRLRQKSEREGAHPASAAAISLQRLHHLASKDCMLRCQIDLFRVIITATAPMMQLLD